MRRSFLLAAAPFVAPARAQSRLFPEWLGAYAGAARFYRSIPLEDIVPPPRHPRVDTEDRTPFGIYFSISAEENSTTVWLRIDGGPMQTTTDGETLHFGPITAGFARLTSAQAKPAPKTANLLLRPDSLGTEALFAFADGSLWRRHFNARFTRTGAELILWVFDAHGTRARTWRGSALHFPAAPQDGRAPT
jgi:hypothetical protein